MTLPFSYDAFLAEQNKPGPRRSKLTSPLSYDAFEEEERVKLQRTGMNAPMVITAKAPGVTERVLARTALEGTGRTDLGYGSEQLTPAQQQQLARAQMGRAMSEELGKGYVGGLSGVAKSAISTADVFVPDALSRPTLERLEEARQRATPEGASAQVGEALGYLGGEMLQGGLAGKLIAGKLPTAGRLGQLRQALESRNVLKQGAATAAVNLPIDVLQGLKSDEGFVLPGTAGSIAENIAMSGGAGGLMALFGIGSGAAKTADRVQFPERAPKLTPERRANRLLGPGTPPVVEGPGIAMPGVPQQITDPARLLASGLPSVRTGTVPGPGIPMPGVGPQRITNPSRILPAQSSWSPFWQARTDISAPNSPLAIALRQAEEQAEQMRVRRRPSGAAVASTTGPVQGPLESLEASEEAVQKYLQGRKTSTEKAVEQELNRYLTMDPASAQRLKEGRALDVYPDGTPRVTLEDADAAVYNPKGGTKRLSDRDLELQLAALRREIGERRAAMSDFLNREVRGEARGGTWAESAREASGAGKSTSWMRTPAQKAAITRAKNADSDLGLSQRKRLTAGERHRLGYDLSEETREAIENAGYGSVEEWRNAERQFRRFEREVPKLDERLAALEAESARRGLDKLPEEVPSGVTTEPPREIMDVPIGKPPVGRQPRVRNVDDYALEDVTPAREMPEAPAELPASTFRNRPGFAAPETMVPVATSGIGALAGGAAPAETPEERLSNAIYGALGGAAVGAAGVKGARRLMGALESTPRPTPRPTPTLELTPTPEPIKTTNKLLASNIPPATPRTTPLEAEIDPELYVNTARFSDDPAIQQRLAAAMKRAVEEVEIPQRATPEDVAAGTARRAGELRNQESFDTVRAKVASELGLKPEDIIARAKDGKPLDRFDMLTIRNALQDTFDEQTAVMQRVDEITRRPDLASSPDEITALNYRLGLLIREQNSLLETFSIGRTQQGRDLNALKIAARSTLDPVAWQVHVQKYARRPLTEAELAAIRKAATDKDRDELMRLAQEARKATWQEKFAALYKAGLLTAPRTHMSNAIGNTFMAVLEGAKDAPATFFDAMLSASTGVRTKAFDPVAMARASGRGAVQGAKDAEAVMRGKIPSTQTDLDLPREINFDNPFLNLYTKTVFRSLSASDQFFKNMAIARSIDEQARLLAEAEGLKGQAFKDRVVQLITKPTDTMAARAIGDAEIATFTESSQLSKTAIYLRNGLNKVTGGVGGDILFPFAKTPANIAQRIIQYSPANFAYQIGRLAGPLLKGTVDAKLQKEVVEQLGRGFTGSAAIYLGYAMAQNDRMSGFFPDNQRERDAWEAQGKIEGAMKLPEVFGDNWIQINKLSPLGNLMQIGAQMWELQKNPRVDPWSFAAGTAAAPFRSVSELPMVANVNDIIDFFKAAGGPETGEAAMSIAARSATAAIPFSGLLRSVAQGIDPTVRETKAPTTLERAANQMQATIPFASRGLPARVDPLGREQQRVMGPVESIFSPLQRRPDLTATDPVRAALAKTGASIGRIERLPTETGEQYAQRERMTGGLINQVLGNVIQSPGYKAIDTMGPERIRFLMERYAENADPGKPIDFSKVSDDRIRSRLQGIILERAASQVKSEITKATRPKGEGTIRRVMESILR